MRRLLWTVATGALLVLPSTALAVGARMTFPHPKGATLVFTNPQNTPVNGRYAAWTRESQEPTITGRVQIWSASLCQGARGCSEYYKTQRIAVLHAQNRDIFYYEMGHLYDYEKLTWHERGKLAHIWGVYGRSWNNSFKALQDGREDGLAADFAAAYAACAEGQPTAGLAAGDAPAIHMGDTCHVLRSL